MSAKDLALNLLIKAKDTASGVVRSFSKEVKDSGTAADQLDQSLDQADKGIESTGKQFNKTGEQARDFRAKVDEARTSTERLTGDTRGSKFWQRWSKGSQDASRDTKKFQKDLNDIPAAARNAEGGIAGLTKKLIALGGTYLGITAIKNAIMGLINTGSRFEDMSVQINTLMGSIEEGEKATAWIKDFATKTPADIEGITQGFIKLKAFGIDPMNGSYQAIIDQTAKLGFSQEKMEGVILALGQAWTKQKLQGEEALQLIERGVPVWDLLSEATGRTAVELQNMASNGELGRKEIELLMKAMGENSKGAADEAMKTWTGLVSNLKDMWLNFVNDINEAGVLDYMKQQLKELLDQGNAMAKDGRLKQYAESIASSIITIASSLKQFMASVVGDFEGSIRATGAMIGALKIAINGFTAGVKVIGMGVSAFFSTTLETAAKAMDLVPGFSETAEKLRREAKAMEAVSHEFKEALKEDSNDIRDAWKLLNGEAFDTAKSELEGLQQESIKVGEAAQESGEKAEAAGKAIAEGAGAGEEATRELNRSLEALGVDITKIETGFTEMGREALDAFDAVQTELKRTGVTGKEAAEITGAAFDKTLARISTAKGLDELKAKLKQAAENGTISWEEYRKKLKEIEEKYSDLKKASKDSIDAQENDLKRLANQAGKTAKSFKDKASFTESDTAANKENAASTEEQTDSLGSYTHALFMAGKSQKEFAEMGSQMASEFDRIWQEIENEYKGKELPGIPSGAYLAEMKKAETAMNKMAEESIHRWNQQEQAIRSVEAALESGQRMSESVLDGLDLIDSQRLEGVRSAIRSMNEEARQVEESLKGTVASLQQQLADLRGDRERSEQLAHEQQMLKLREQYEEAKERGGNEAVRAAREAMNLQEQIHQERMKQVREQKQADEARKREQQTVESINPAAPGTPATSAPPPRPSTPDRVVRVELDLGMGRPVAGEFEPSAAEALLQQLNTVRRTS